MFSVYISGTDTGIGKTLASSARCCMRCAATACVRSA
jgi:dethiobiotin synthetase